jgi:hypothetical protein
MNVSEKLSIHSGLYTSCAAHSGGTGATTDAPPSQVHTRTSSLQLHPTRIPPSKHPAQPYDAKSKQDRGERGKPATQGNPRHLEAPRPARPMRAYKTILQYSVILISLTFMFSYLASIWIYLRNIDLVPNKQIWHVIDQGILAS